MDERRIYQLHLERITKRMPRPVASIGVDGVTTFVNLPDGDSHVDFLRDHTGGRAIDRVAVAQDIDLWVDDEFLYRDEEDINLVATVMATLLDSHLTYPIRGGVLAAGHDGPETVPLTYRQVTVILGVHYALGHSGGDVTMA